MSINFFLSRIDVLKKHITIVHYTYSIYKKKVLLSYILVLLLFIFIFLSDKVKKRGLLVVDAMSIFEAIKYFLRNILIYRIRS